MTDNQVEKLTNIIAELLCDTINPHPDDLEMVGRINSVIAQIQNILINM